MTEGKSYKITNAHDVVFKAKLLNIVEYGATGMPSDYIFEPLDGEKAPISIDDSGTFPLPQMVIDNFVEEL